MTVNQPEVGKQLARVYRDMTQKLTPHDAVVLSVNPLVLQTTDGQRVEGAVAVGAALTPNLPVILMIGSGRALAFRYVQEGDPEPGQLSNEVGGRLDSIGLELETVKDDAQGVGSVITDMQRRPAQVTGLGLVTTAYTDVQGTTQARITANWEDVLNADPEDGGGTLDIAGYEVSVRRNEIAAPWGVQKTVVESDADLEPFPSGVSIQVRVRALSASKVPGEWSDTETIVTAGDTTPPPVPSTPQLEQKLGVVMATWDGKTSTGSTTWPTDLVRIEVAVGTTDTPTSVRASLTTGGTYANLTNLPYKVQHWVRFRSVDRSGNASNWSAAASITVQALVDEDLINTTLSDQFAARDDAIAQAQDDVEAARSELATVHGLASQATQDAQDAHNAAVDAKEAADTAQTAAGNAQTTAGNALISANGRNSRITSTGDPSGTTNPRTGQPWVEGDTWWKWDSTTARNVIGAWTYRNGKWELEKIRDEVLASLDLNKLIVTGSAHMTQAVVEKIIGDAAYFKAITSDKIVVTSSEGLYPDSGFDDVALSAQRASNSGWTYDANAKTMTGSTTLWLTKSGQSSDWASVPFRVGGTYVVRVWATNWTSSVRVSRWDSTGHGFVSPSNIETLPDGAEIVVTILGSQGRISLWSDFPSEGLVISRIEIRSQIGGVLIEDGAITADKIYADEVMAKKMAAVFAEFGTVLTNFLRADHILAGSFKGYSIEGAEIISRNPSNPNLYVRLKDQELTFNRLDTSENPPEEIVTTRLGGKSSDRLTLADLSGNIGVSFDGATGDGALTGHLDVDSLSVGGDRLHDMIDPAPKGVVALYQSSADSPQAGTGALGLASIIANTSTKRMYRLSISGMLAATNPGDQAQLSLATWYGSSSAFLQYGNFQIPTSRAEYVHMERIFRGLYNGSARFGIRYYNVTANRGIFWSGRNNYPVTFMLEDLGAAQYNVGYKDQFGGTPITPGTVVDETPATTYTKEYPATWSRSWRGSTIVSDYLHQGYWGGYQRYSMVGFGGTLASDLSGATNISASVYLSNVHWYSGSGTVRVSSATSTSAPSSAVLSGAVIATSMAKGAKAYVPVGGFEASSRAITLGYGTSSSNTSTTYGKFLNNLSTIKLRVTYTK